MMKMTKTIQDWKTKFNKDLEILKIILDEIEKLSNSTRKLKGKFYR